MRRQALALALGVFLGGCGGTASAPPDPTASGTTAPASSAPASVSSPDPDGPQIVDLGGAGPLGIAVVGDTAFVVLEAAGELVAVDLAAGAVTTRIPIGSGAMLVDAREDLVIVGRYSAPDGEGLLVVDRGSGEIVGIATGDLAGLSLNGSDRAWALGTAGEVLMVDLVDGVVTDRGAIEIHELEHLNGVATGGSFFASSDTTPVRRLDLDGSGIPFVTATIETGGGIPFVVDGDLVWGARADELWAIDPVGSDVRQRIPLAGLIEILALDVDVAGDEAWIAGRRPGHIGTVVAIRPSTGELIGEHDAGLPAGVAIVDGRAWVTDYEANALLGFER